jgi:uncharacterized membrane protein
MHMPSRRPIHMPPNPTARAADMVTAFAGSWWFLGLHATWFTLWIALRLEPFPFGLLTMIVSLEAIFLSTLVMMAQNRQAARDRLRDDHEAAEVDVLYQINQQQLEILTLLRQRICTEDVTREADEITAGLGQPAITVSPATAPPPPRPWQA